MIKKNKEKLLVILGIIILPLIYSLVYLAAFWDPYGNLEDISVALVNEDDCREEVCLGEELVNNLKEKNTFDFSLVDSKTANNGLINKDYYAVITIPSNFTNSIGNAGRDKQQTIISYSPNTKTNYLASQILKNAVSEVEKNLESQVTEKVVQKLTDNLQEVPKQTAQISSAFNQISDGSKKVDSGVSSLSDGSSNLLSNYKNFNDGIHTLNNGSMSLYNSYKELDQGINDVYDGSLLLKEKTNNLTSLTSNALKLKNGSDELNNGIKDYKVQSNDMIDKTALAYSYLIDYVNNHPEVQSDEGLMMAYQIALGYTTKDSTGYNGLENLKMATDKLSLGSDSVNSGINSLYESVDSLTQLKSGIDTLEQSLLKIKNGSNSVYLGINDLNNGINSLNNSSNKVNNGISSLDNGVQTLKNGTGSLVNGIAKAQTATNEKINETENSVNELDGLAQYTKDPIKVEEDDYGDVNKYGISFSPYFISLSLWIGGVLILMGLYFDPEQRFKILGKNSENRMLRVVLYGVIGIMQAIILGFLLKLLLGYEITNVFVYYGSCILISITFLSIILFLFTTFKDVGKFIALVLLVLQLASCGGTFPIETEPQIYQMIYPFMPMTYSLDLLKESFVNINSSFLVKDILVLLGIFVTFTLLTIVVGIIKNKNNGKLIKR